MKQFTQDKKLLFVELNEINLCSKNYIKEYNLKTFKDLFKLNYITTKSENTPSLLEPWIQWTSVYTGLRAKSHRVKHLDDIKNCKSKQIFFEVIESKGFSVESD